MPDDKQTPPGEEMAALRRQIATLEAEKAALEARGMPLFDKASAERIERTEAKIDALTAKLEKAEAALSNFGAQAEGNPLLGGLFSIFKG